MANNQNDPHPLTRERKVGFVFLLIFAMLTVSLGALQLRNTIYGPFVRAPLANELADNELLLDETVRLQNIDTDQDGLNDYEELYFYETSPYLPDTDSDGIEDKDELDGGTDPLCPKGTVCDTAEELPDQPRADVGSPLLENTPGVGDLLFGEQNGAAGQSSLTDPASILQNINALLLDPAQLRKALLATGKIKKEELDAFTDEQLSQTVRKLMEEQDLETLFGL